MRRAYFNLSMIYDRRRDARNDLGDCPGPLRGAASPEWENECAPGRTADRPIFLSGREPASATIRKQHGVGQGLLFGEGDVPEPSDLVAAPPG